MLAKTWKKILLIILIIACSINIVSKLMHNMSFNKTIEQAKNKIQVMVQKD